MSSSSPSSAMSSSSSTLTSLVFLNLPTSSLFGLNISSFNTTDRFRGVKNIPAGLHFCYFSVAPKTIPDKKDSKGKHIIDVDAEFSASSALGVRNGFFFTAPPPPSAKDGGLIVKKWDGKNECLVDPEDVDVENVKKNLVEISREYLAPYENLQAPSAKHEVWRNLTAHARSEASVLDRILGGGKWECESTLETTWETDELDTEIAAANSSSTTTTSSSTQTPHHNEEKKKTRGLGYTRIDLKRTWPPDAVGRERTVWARDKSWALGEVIRRLSPPPEEEPQQQPITKMGKKRQQQLSPGESSLLAELSVSLILSVLLANYSSTSQFKSIVELSLSSAAAIRTHPLYMRELLRLLQSCFEFARLALGEDDAAKRAEEEEEEDDDGYGGGGGGGGGNGIPAEEAVLEEFIGGGDTFLKEMLRKFGRNLDYAAEDDRDAAAAVEDDNDAKGGSSSTDTPQEVIDAFAEIKKFAFENFSWYLDDSYVRRGMLQLPPEEGAGAILVEMDDMEGEDERGEYAPVIVET